MRATFEIKQRPPRELPAPADGGQAGVTRRRARKHLHARGLSCVADEAVLIVSELLTNAAHSGGRRTTVSFSLRSGFLRIDVCDGVPGFHLRPEALRDTTWCELRLAAH